MVHVKAHAEVVPHHAPDPLGCPQLRGVAGRLGALGQKPHQRSALPIRQLRRSTRPRATSQSLSPLPAGQGKPLTHRRTADSETPRDVGLGNTTLEQVQRLIAPLFESQSISSFCHTTSIIQAKKMLTK